MSDTLNYNINIGGNANESIGNIKKQLKEASAELIQAQKNFGDYSNEAINAAKKVAALRDSVQEARETADLFDPGKKFQALSGTLTAVAGGFSAIQGAIGLVGGESKDLEKQLLKVQSALALSQGLSTITDSAKDFQRLAAVIKTQVVTAFSTLRGAIIATGVGALAVALGLVIANFEKVKKVVLDLIPGLGGVADFIGKLVNKVTDFIGVTSEAGRATAKLIKDNDKALKDSERNLELNGDKYDEYTRRKIEANNEFKRKQNEFLKDEQLSEDERNRYILQAREKANRDILKSDEDREENRKRVAKEAADKEKKDQEERERKEKERRLKEIEKVVAGRLDEDPFIAIENRRQEAIKNTDAVIQGSLEKNIQAVGARVNAEKAAEIEKQKAEDESAKYVAIREQNKQNAYLQTGAVLGELANLAGQQTRIGKALTLAQIGIDTASAISSLTKNSEANPTNAVTFGASGVVQFATGLIRILANVKRAKDLLSSSGSIPSISAPSISSAPVVPRQPQAQLTQLNEQSINAIGNSAIRAYVVETDVTSNQKRVQAIKQRARFS